MFNIRIGSKWWSVASHNIDRACIQVKPQNSTISGPSLSTLSEIKVVSLPHTLRWALVSPLCSFPSTRKCTVFFKQNPQKQVLFLVNATMSTLSLVSSAAVSAVLRLSLMFWMLSEKPGIIVQTFQLSINIENFFCYWVHWLQLHSEHPTKQSVAD